MEQYQIVRKLELRAELRIIPCIFPDSREFLRRLDSSELAAQPNNSQITDGASVTSYSVVFSVGCDGSASP